MPRDKEVVRYPFLLLRRGEEEKGRLAPAECLLCSCNLGLEGAKALVDHPPYHLIVLHLG
tara:strand:+ start:617 stop:796 length:180 start_codon:yes stop_codon:yes gene_type:complete